MSTWSFHAEALFEAQAVASLRKLSDRFVHLLDRAMTDSEDDHRPLNVRQVPRWDWKHMRNFMQRLAKLGCNLHQEKCFKKVHGHCIVAPARCGLDTVHRTVSALSVLGLDGSVGERDFLHFSTVESRTERLRFLVPEKWFPRVSLSGSGSVPGPS